MRRRAEAAGPTKVGNIGSEYPDDAAHAVRQVQSTDQVRHSYGLPGQGVSGIRNTNGE